MRERFDTMAGMAERALRRLGVDAHVGAVPGEYCPGDHSVNARGSVKLVGVGQRVMRGAAHVGGVIVVNDAKRVRDGLVPVYRELELEMDPEAVGSVEDEVGGVTLDGVVDALLQEFAEHGPWREGEFRPDQLERAAELESQHRC